MKKRRSICHSLSLWGYQLCGGDKHPKAASLVANSLYYFAKVFQFTAATTAVAAILHLALHIPLLAHAINHIANIRTLGLFLGIGVNAEEIKKVFKSSEPTNAGILTRLIGPASDKAAANLPNSPKKPYQQDLKVSAISSSFFSNSSSTATKKAEISAKTKPRP